MQPIDIKILRQKLKEAAQNALIETKKKYAGDCCAFALYSDEGVLTMAAAANTVSHLTKMKATDPDNEDYYKWSPAEWENEGNLAQSEFNELSTILRDTVLQKNYTGSFPRLKETVFEMAVSVLEELKAENWFTKDIILVFTLTDYDNPKQESSWIKRLNDSSTAEEFRLWRNSWQ